ncbi:sigma-54-dependent transcriptional regulator [Tanticharoenia sakaeratensis]|nr:sigma 54-interacting transcriptional regulator [Tanticharoenia sakaeratensis]
MSVSSTGQESGRWCGRALALRPIPAITNTIMPQSDAVSAILPTVLLLDPDRAIRTVLAQALGRAGYQARAAASVSALMAWIEDGEGDLLIADHATLTSGDAAEQISSARPELPVLRLGGSVAGPHDLPKPFDLPLLLNRVSALLQAPAQSATMHALALRAPSALTGVSSSIEELRQGVARLSASVLPLMLLGERGCGRSMVVRVLHESGPRRNGPLVIADTAAIPPADQVTWLTGNTAEDGGLFARATFGTLYLANLQALAPQAQVALLTLLQDRAHPPDFRLVVSANDDLAALARAGRFRADLYYRLDTVRLRVPPLRERREDIGILAAHFWQAAHVGAATSITDGARSLLSRQDWPGNLDALKTAIGRIASVHPGPTLDEAMVRADLMAEPGRNAAETGRQAPVSPSTPAAPPFPSAPAPAETLQAAIGRHIEHYLAAHDLSSAVEGRLHEEVIAEVERPLISGVLAATGGNQIRAAALLGMNRNTLRKRIRDLGIATRVMRAPARGRRAEPALDGAAEP